MRCTTKLSIVMTDTPVLIIIPRQWSFYTALHPFVTPLLAYQARAQMACALSAAKILTFEMM